MVLMSLQHHAVCLILPARRYASQFFFSTTSVRLSSHHVSNMLARLSEDGGFTDDIAAVRAELEETHAQLEASLARNALLSPFEKGYLPLNSP